jgi:hypothetical protein
MAAVVPAHSAALVAHRRRAEQVASGEEAENKRCQKWQNEATNLLKTKEEAPKKKPKRTQANPPGSPANPPLAIVDWRLQITD